jgi:hypothetical protein
MDVLFKSRIKIENFYNARGTTWCAEPNVIYQLTENHEVLIYTEDSFGALQPQDEPYIKPTFSNPTGKLKHTLLF